MDREINHLWRYADDRLDLQRCDEIWTGWHIHGPRLVSPEAWEFSPGQILAGRLRHDEVRALRVDLRRARESARAYSPRLAQWHTLRAALRSLEADIRTNGADDELQELRSASSAS